MKTRKLISLLLSIFMLASVLPAGVSISSAAEIVDSGMCGNNVSWTLDSDGLLTISGTGAMLDYDYYIDNPEIPFADNESIKSVVIEDGVTFIGRAAFYGCSQLASIELADSFTRIGGRAFEGTSWLDSQPDGVVYAGKVAYTYKGDMPENTQITLRNGTQGIAEAAFADQTNLISVTIPYGVKMIDEWAFYKCTSLLRVKLPRTITHIGPYSFHYCPIQYTIFGGTQEEFEEIRENNSSAFRDYLVIEYGDRINDDWYWAVKGGLGKNCLYTDETYGQGAVSINENGEVKLSGAIENIFSAYLDLCFEESIGDIEVVIDDICTDDVWWCILCINPEVITLSDSVGNIDFIIDFFTYLYFPDLKAINVSENNEYYTSIDGVLFSKDGSELIWYPASREGSTYVVPDGVSEISDYAFANSRNLTDIYFPTSLQNVGSFSFSYPLTAAGFFIAGEYITAEETLEVFEYEKNRINYVQPGVREKMGWSQKTSDLYFLLFTVELRAIESFIDNSENGLVLQDVWYASTEEDWANVTIGEYNDALLGATMHFASAEHVHTPGDAVIENEVAATCTNAGSYDEVVYCSECGDELSRTEVTTEMLPHTAVTDPAVGATCTSFGYTEGSHCSVCGKILTPREQLEKLPHVDGDGDEFCDNCGADLRRTCNWCGKVHPANVFGWIVSYIHDILYTFAALFGAR